MPQVDAAAMRRFWDERSREDAFFFVSAGPDRQYLTRQDNLYSYETSNFSKIPRTAATTRAN